MLGALFGAAKATMVLGAIFWLLSNFAGPRETLEKARFAMPLADAVKSAATFLPDSYRAEIDGQVEQANSLPQKLLEQGRKSANIPSGF
jgi:hypothetical protein